MKKTVLKTKSKIIRDKRDMNIFLEYSSMMETEGAMATVIYDILMKKYKLCLASVWGAKKRGEELLKKQQETGK
jgi:hypothetical protein